MHSVLLFGRAIGGFIEMMTRQKLNLSLLLLLGYILFYPATAWAYVDPGSTSILLQVIFAFVVGGFLTFRRKFAMKIKSAYRWLIGRGKNP